MSTPRKPGCQAGYSDVACSGRLARKRFELSFQPPGSSATEVELEPPLRPRRLPGRDGARTGARRMIPALYVIESAATDGFVHVANAPVGSSGGAALTLCGWVDVAHDDAPFGAAADCPDCLAIVAYCRKLKLPAQRVLSA